jgi:site-specific DNA-methyltransferase (adenine-specific)
MSDAWQIIAGDCREVMSTLDPGSVRLVFADPPYNQGVKYGPHYNDRLTPEKYLALARVWIPAAARLLTDDGSFWLLISHEWDWQLIPLALAAGLHYRQPITWYEKFGVNCKRKFNLCTRSLLWFTRHPTRFVFNASDPEIRRPSARQTEYNDKRANPNGKLLDNVWNIPRVAGTHRERLPEFPTQLPIRLLRRVVACASEPGDLVLDPFNGSGTSGAACLELGRRYTGIEQSEFFATRARLRLENLTPPLALTDV